jgi:hypothetical protein
MSPVEISQQFGGGSMNKTLIAAAIAIALAPVGAQAQERVGDAALGAASGIILGPVGIVAGAVVGYTVGPNIASAWGVRRHRTSHRAAHYARRAPRSSTVAPGTGSQVASVQTDEPAPPPAPAAVPVAPAPAAPASVPVQGFE